MPGTDTIAVYLGEDVVLTFVMDPVEDVTGWTLLFTAKTKAGIEVEANAVVTDGPAGEFTVDLADTDIESLGVGRHNYDVWRTDAGSERVLAIGRFTVSAVVRDTV